MMSDGSRLSQYTSVPEHVGYDQPGTRTGIWTINGQVVDPYGTEEVRGDSPINWLVPAILVTLFCFPPSGAVSIYCAKKANVARSQGDLTAFHQRSAQSRNLVLASLLLGIAVYAVIFGFFI